MFIARFEKKDTSQYYIIYSKAEKLQLELKKIQHVILSVLSVSNKKSPETAHMVPTNFPRPVVGAMSP